jgi:hypothetical protein
MAGLTDVLSVYRESISSERQSRMAEMQIALSALQYESEREFREAGRQRENALMVLQDAKQNTRESVSQDTGEIVSGMSGLIERDTSGGIYSFKKQSRLQDSGLSEKDQMDIYNIVSLYSSDSEGEQKLGQSAAKNFAKRFANEYKVWSDSGFSTKKKGKFYEYKSELIQGLENSGLLYGGSDNYSRQLSAEPFLMVPEALSALDRIQQETQEIGQGDYEIQSDLSFGAEGYVPPEGLILDLADRVSEGGLPSYGQGSALEDFKLTKEEEAKKAKLDININKQSIIELETQKQDLQYLSKVGEISKSGAADSLRILSKQISDIKKETKVLDKLEKESRKSSKRAQSELGQRHFGKMMEIAGKSGGLRY